MYYTKEQIDRAGNEYRWKRHDSLTVWAAKRNGKIQVAKPRHLATSTDK